jgi:hypothetical protein
MPDDGVGDLIWGARLDQGQDAPVGFERMLPEGCIWTKVLFGRLVCGLLVLQGGQRLEHSEDQRQALVATVDDQSVVESVLGFLEQMTFVISNFLEPLDGLSQEGNHSGAPIWASGAEPTTQRLNGVHRLQKVG